MAEKKDSIRSLIETGRRAGKLTNSEISDAMEERARRTPPSAGVPSSSVKLTIDTSIAPNVMPMPM